MSSLFNDEKNSEFAKVQTDITSISLHKNPKCENKLF